MSNRPIKDNPQALAGNLIREQSQEEKDRYRASLFNPSRENVEEVVHKIINEKIISSCINTPDGEETTESGAAPPGGRTVFVKGDTGEKGEKGDTGEKGERGERGPAGESIIGPAGRDGRDGIDGRSIVGAPGRDGRDGTDGETIIGPAGRDGRDGADGKSIVGPPGRDGLRGEKVTLVKGGLLVEMR